MIVDLVALLVFLAVFGTPHVLFARWLLHGQAKRLGVPPHIHWTRLMATTTVLGLLFSAAWLVPVVLLSAPDDGPQKLGAAYILGLALSPTLAFMPVVSSLSSYAHHFLSPTTDSRQQPPKGEGFRD